MLHNDPTNRSSSPTGNQVNHPKANLSTSTTSASIWQTFRAYSKLTKRQVITAFEYKEAKATSCQKRNERLWIQSTEKNSAVFGLQSAKVTIDAFLAALSIQYLNQSVIPQQPNFTSSPPLKAFAYADDVLVFFTRPTELQTLLYLVSLCSKASNTRLNRGKTMAVSLSGEDHHDWRQTLFANGVTQCHDKRASSATTYLGYPLTSSAQQLSSYLDSLIKNFPFVKFQDCQRPRNEGGIAILSPSTQYSALQIRWHIPLILSSDLAPTPDSFATSFMKYILCALSFALSPFLPLLFPERRTTDLHRLGCFNTLFNTIDQIDFEIDWTALNASSVSEIPLSRIYPLLLTNDPYHTSLWMESLPPITSFLSRKQRNRSETYFDLLSLGHVKEENFFAALRSTSDLSPGLIISSLGFPPPEPEFHSLLSSPLPDGTPIENISTKWFRHIDKLPAS
ncbi:hypothetical protein G6F60_002892 [Rhizopus arrhizus]|nr:hypothetical protein G6F61_006943 [Rhizopus arrhizus]KAG1406488.1 hypothetical protein G6F60_002892 [Rhizopus arrhizus]